MEFDPVLLSRIQFAFTISFHILFPAFTIGLASWLVVLEGLWLKTGNPNYREIYKFWVKIFAVTFGMGVVSGVVLSYQIGTNWSSFSDKVGNVLGPLLSFEVLTAFFLESSFLGIMLFGWERVSRKMHFISTIVVALGTLFSAFWILSANSWMHTPVGYEIRDNMIFHPLNWFDIIFNPSFPYRFFHMVTAAYLTTAFVVAGVSAWYLLHHKFIAQARIMFGMGMLMAIFVTPIQILFGDQQGLNTLQHQPAKIAALEGIWDTEKGVPFTIMGWPDENTESTKYSLQIPKAGSLILTHTLDGEVKGLKNFAKEDRPPIKPVFFAFRIMVAIGFLMFLTGIIAFILNLRKKLFQSKAFQKWCIFMSPSGFVAVLCGWMVTEIGRQPYVVYGLLRTKEAISPVIGNQVFLSLMVFIFAYAIIFGAGIYYIFSLIRKGPKQLSDEDEKTYGEHGIKCPVLLSDIFNHKDKMYAK